MQTLRLEIRDNRLEAILKYANLNALETILERGCSSMIGEIIHVQSFFVRTLEHFAEKMVLDKKKKKKAKEKKSSSSCNYQDLIISVCYLISLGPHSTDAEVVAQSL